RHAHVAAEVATQLEAPPMLTHPRPKFGDQVGATLALVRSVGCVTGFDRERREFGILQRCEDRHSRGSSIALGAQRGSAVLRELLEFEICAQERAKRAPFEPNANPLSETSRLGVDPIG